jgi:hypothetical protein
VKKVQKIKKLKTSPSARLRNTARHEAAHAVVHCLYRLDFDSVEIVGTDSTYGGLHRPNNATPQEWGRREQADWEELAIAMLAGPIAQRLATGRSAWFNGGHGDLTMVHQIMTGKLYHLPLRDRDAYLDSLHSRTLSLLSHPAIWSQVEKVADALLDRMRLTRRQVHKIVDLTAYWEAVRIEFGDRYGWQARLPNEIDKMALRMEMLDDVDCDPA